MARNKHKPALERTAKGSTFTALVLEIMRVHGLLREHGERLTEAHGLTVARWPVLGAIEKQPLTASQIGRRMGVSRQNVQRVVNALVSEGLVELMDNPDHSRAPLVRVLPAGATLLSALHADQAVWANKLAEHLSIAEWSQCLRTLSNLATILETDS